MKIQMASTWCLRPLAGLTLLTGAAHAQVAGDLDPSFGGTGVVQVQGSDPAATFLAARAEGGTVIQPDGKIVVAGQAQDASNSGQFVLLRFHPDGTLDTSFDGDGRVAVQLADPLSTSRFPDSRPWGMVLQPDGKLVVSGHAAGPDLEGTLGVARFHPDGSLDAGFGVGGIARIQGSDPAFPFSQSMGTALQADGKIVLACDCVDGNGDDVLGAVRLHPDGSLDAGFGTGGIVRTQAAHPLSPDQFSRPLGGVAVAPDGKIVVVGSARPSGGDVSWVTVVRYDPDGTLDAGFANGGILLTRASVPADPHGPGGADAVAITPDGKILVGASPDTALGHEEFAVIRLNADGSFDTSFGTDGIAYAEVGAAIDPDGEVEGMTLQPDGRILVVGETSDEFDEDVFAIARFEADGVLDTSFGTGGIVRLQASDPTASSQSSEARSAAVQADGNIVVFGTARDAANTRSMAVARVFGETSIVAAVLGIGGDIDAIVAGGGLTAGQANGLTRPLDNVLKSLDKGKLAPACSQLQDFIDEVDSKMPVPLDPADGADLIDAAEAVRIALGC